MIGFPYRLVGVIAVLAGCFAAGAQLVQLRHWSGQAIAPVYEGFDVNPDGSFNLWFGHMNRNYLKRSPILPSGRTTSSNRAPPIVGSRRIF